MQIPLLGRTAQGKYPLNLFYQPERGDQRAALIGTPGLKLYADLGKVGPVRCMQSFRGYVYALCGNTVYRVDSNGSSLALSPNIETSNGNAWTGKNISQIYIGDGEFGYSVIDDSVSKIGSGFPNSPVGVGEQDTYIIVVHRPTGRFYVSDNNDITTWDALNFANPEGNPDFSRTIISDHRELWIPGKESTEVFYNSGGLGGSSFTFNRIEGAFIEKGIGAPAAICKVDNSVFWLTDKFQVVRATGYVPEIISTRMIESEIAKYTNKEDAIMFAYEQAGHSFVFLIFPDANTTWVYDAATKRWARRGSYPKHEKGRHRANCYCYHDTKHLIGDYENGKIYEFDLQTYDDDGEIIKAQHIFPPVISPNREYYFHHMFECECTTGEALATGQGSNPIAILDWSGDNYKTWSNEHWLSIGTAGDYTATVRETALGCDRWRAYRMTITDPVFRQIISPYLEATLGRHS